jgi:hypothetical protein
VDKVGCTRAGGFYMNFAKNDSAGVRGHGIRRIALGDNAGGEEKLRAQKSSRVATTLVKEW